MEVGQEVAKIVVNQQLDEDSFFGDGTTSLRGAETVAKAEKGGRQFSRALHSPIQQALKKICGLKKLSLRASESRNQDRIEDGQVQTIISLRVDSTITAADQVVTSVDYGKIILDKLSTMEKLSGRVERDSKSEWIYGRKQLTCNGEVIYAFEDSLEYCFFKLCWNTPGVKVTIEVGGVQKLIDLPRRRRELIKGKAEVKKFFVAETRFGASELGALVHDDEDARARLRSRILFQKRHEKLFGNGLGGIFEGKLKAVYEHCREESEPPKFHEFVSGAEYMGCLEVKMMSANDHLYSLVN